MMLFCWETDLQRSIYSIDNFNAREPTLHKVNSGKWCQLSEGDDLVWQAIHTKRESHPEWTQQQIVTSLSVSQPLVSKVLCQLQQNKTTAKRNRVTANEVPTGEHPSNGHSSLD
jgi:hypothetical protein